MTPKNNIVGSKPASRDVEEVPGETHTSSWDTISLIICLSGESVDSIDNSGGSYPKKGG